jgi:hypothetical protein
LHIAYCTFVPFCSGIISHWLPGCATNPHIQHIIE